MSKRRRIEKHSDDRKRQADMQVDGDHYADFDVDPARWCYRNNLDLFQGFVIKHIARADLKGEAKEDLKKAIHYAAMKLEEDFGIVSKVEYIAPKREDEGGNTGPVLDERL